MKKQLFILVIFLISLLWKDSALFAQNVGINGTGATANAAAMLDIVSTTKGLLIPRVTAAQKTAMNPLPAAAQGLFVYQTDGVQGFYYNTSITTTPTWVMLAGWSLLGNASTTPSTSAIGSAIGATENFVGTTDAQALVLGTNDLERMRILSTGNIGIGTTSPSYKLEVVGTGGGNQSIYSRATDGGSNRIGLQNTNRHWSITNYGTTTLPNGILAIADETAGLVRLAIDINGNVGFGTSLPSNMISLDGHAARIIGVERNGTTNTAGNNLTVQAGGAAGGATDKVGGDLILKTGTSTGTGAASMHFYTATASGSTGTTDNAPTEKMTILGSGYVGIATNNPLTSLNVNGGISSTPSSGAAGATITIPANVTVYRITDEGAVAANAISATSPQEGQYLTIYNTDAQAATFASVTIPASSGVGLFQYINAGWRQISVSNSSSGAGWTLLGNAGTVDGTNFIGTTDNIPFNVRVNNQKSGRIDPTLNNSFWGYQSGNATTVSGNTGVGAHSLFNNSTGVDNTAVGTDALYNNTTGYQNIAIGFEAMYLQSFSNGGSGWNGNNVAVGSYALFNNQPTAASNGVYNTAIGYMGLNGNTTGKENTSLGAQALQTNSTANYNTALGKDALYTNSTGSNNTATGWSALYSNTAANNTANGYKTLYANTSGTNNTAAGYQALTANTSASDNVALGANALGANTASSQNVAVGSGALATQSYSTAQNTGNTAVGYAALNHTNPTGVNAFDNTALGSGALYTNTSHSGNTALGFQALYTCDNNDNTAVGNQALFSQTSGSFNTAVGEGAGMYNVTGAGNTLMGHLAGNGVSGNSYANNSIFGYFAGKVITTGSNNILYGYQAGDAITTGSNNIIIGYDVDAPSATASSQLSIGNLIFATGGFGTGTTIGTGSIGIATASPGQTLDINGTAKCTASAWTSDIRKKKNIQTLTLNGLDIISKLRPVTFEWKEVRDNGTKGTQMGFIAQELEKVLPTMVLTEENAEQSKAVKYNELFPVLVKAIQEQQTLIESQQLSMDKMKAENEILKTTSKNSELRMEASELKISKLEAEIEQLIPKVDKIAEK